MRERLASLLQNAPEEAPAVEYDGVWWRWGETRACARAVSALLTTLGLGSPTRVGLVLENRPEHVAVMVAVLAGGGTVVPYSPLQPASRLAADITRSRPPVVLANPEVFARDGILDAVTTYGHAAELSTVGGVRSVTGRIAGALTQNPGVAIEMLTSGTTGPPKRIEITDRQVTASMAASGQTSTAGGLLSPSVSLVATPIEHTSGLWAALGTLNAGRRMVLMAKFVLDPWVDAVERNGIRAAFLVPAALRSILDGGVPAHRLASVQALMAGAAPCAPDIVDEFLRRYGIRVLVTYGATEYAGAVAAWTYALHEQWWERKRGSVGRAFDGVELRITDEAGREVPAGTEGLLEVRTDQSPLGAGHWSRTTDRARIDEDGFVWILARADNAIMRGGFKVSPETVQRVLERHPAVREAAVIGMDDGRLGQVPVAAIETEHGRSAPTEAELIRLCRSDLAPYERPAHYMFLDELPRTPSTKVSQVDLLTIMRENLETG